MHNIVFLIITGTEFTMDRHFYSLYSAFTLSYTNANKQILTITDNLGTIGTKSVYN